MPINSRAKGKSGELEFAALLREHGYGASRGQQFKGGADSPDVRCDDLGNFHLEVKRVEAGNLYNWLAQAIRDGGQKVPVVAHRRNKQEWVAILRMEDFLNLLLGMGAPDEAGKSE